MVDSLLVDLLEAVLALSIQVVEFGDHVFQVLLSLGTETSDLGNVTGGHVVDGLALATQAGYCAGGHGESHVLGSVDEFENGRRCLIFLDGFNAQYTGVATGAVEEAFAKRAEEFGDERVGFLLSSLVSNCLTEDTINIRAEYGRRHT